MKLEKLKLTNFRNFKNFSEKFEDLNVIVGPNASGKSSILEAISLISTTKSIRAEYDKEMIHRGNEFARVEAQITRDEESVTLEMVIASSDKYENLARKVVKLNGVSKTLNNFAGNLNSVIFTPMDLEIITNGPQLRRKYLDFILIQVSEEYRHSHTNLVKIIRQRNKLLERINKERRGLDELSFWNDSLIKESGIIHKYRSEFLEQIKEPFSHYGKVLSKGKEVLSISYKISTVTKERLGEYRQREIASMNTLIGPNRDDFSIFLKDANLENFGSRGQQRMAILALKLCEIDFIHSKVRARPVLLLDDIFSELDNSHRNQVFEIVNLQQTIITTADESIFQNRLGKFKRTAL